MSEHPAVSYSVADMILQVKVESFEGTISSENILGRLLDHKIQRC